MLHSDLNPGLSLVEQELFYRVIKVYKGGDFRLIKVLDEDGQGFQVRWETEDKQ